MYKGFTLLEVLTALFIISALSVLALPAWQQTNTQMILQKEQHKLYLFLRQIQARVENSSEIWLLIASRQADKKGWCLTPQIKTDNLSNCLSPQTCTADASADFYYPYFP